MGVFLWSGSVLHLSSTKMCGVTLFTFVGSVLESERVENLFRVGML